MKLFDKEAYSYAKEAMDNGASFTEIARVLKLQGYTNAAGTELRAGSIAMLMKSKKFKRGPGRPPKYGAPGRPRKDTSTRTERYVNTPVLTKAPVETFTSVQSSDSQVVSTIRSLIGFETTDSKKIKLIQTVLEA